MHGRTKLIWTSLILSGLLVSPGCVIRRGWVIKYDWSFEAHRTGCRHRWFGGCCRSCQPASCGEATCHADDEEGAPCRARALGGLLHRESVPPPPAPEPPAPSTFHPVPMRPVFGPRSEESDSYDAPEGSLSPVPPGSNNLDMDGEPIDNSEAPVELDKPGPAPQEEAARRPRNTLRASSSSGEVRTVSWQASSRRMKPASSTPASPCSSCVRFRER